MKQPKCFDTYQLILVISFGICFISRAIFSFLLDAFVLANYDAIEAGTVEVPNGLAVPYSVLTFFLIASLAWIIIRFITFRKRKKDYLLEHQK